MGKHRKLQFVILFTTIVALGFVLTYAEPIATWITNWAFVQILDAVSKLGVLIAVIAFLWEIPKRKERDKAERKQRQFEYWQVIDSASASGTSTSYARKIALESLAAEGTALRNIDVPKAELRRINLKGADLVGANLAEADLTDAILERADLSKASLYRARLHGANLSEANLESANLREVLYNDRTSFPQGFNAQVAGAYLIAPRVSLPGVQLPNAILWGAHLQGANLQDSNFSKARFHGALLQNTNFQGANLQEARFRSANLEGANLEYANIKNANFFNAEGLTIQQIKAACNWEEARFSPQLCSLLGL